MMLFMGVVAVFSGYIGVVRRGWWLDTASMERFESECSVAFWG